MIAEVVSVVIGLVADFFAYLLAIRTILQGVRIAPSHPLLQITIKWTQKLTAPLQALLPEVAHVDLALVTAMLIIEWLPTLLGELLQHAVWASFWASIPIAIGKVLGVFVTVYFYGIIARIIFDWLITQHHHYLVFILHQITEPLLKPIRKRMPVVSGFDFSGLAALLALKCFELLVVVPLIHIS